MALLYVSMIAAGSWLLCRIFLQSTQDAREPPMIPHTFPYIGHLIGLLRYGLKLFDMIRARYSTSVYTLRLPGRRLYIISSPRVVAAVDRHPNTLSLGPFALEFVKRVTVISKEGFDALEAGKGTRSFHTDTLKAMNTVLAPGPVLSDTASEVLRGAVRFLDDMKASSEQEEIDLFSWTKSLLTQASTSALYGAECNPFNDPVVETALWAVKDDLARLASGILPNIICPKGQNGRVAVFAAFEKYYREKGHGSASRLIQRRYEVLKGYDLCDDDIAHFDLNVCLGLLINTVPAAYWTLYYVFSQPTLLEELRAAISPFVQISSDSENPTRNVNVAEVAVECPLVTSVVHETLRVSSISTSARKVVEDTLVDGQYLLKQGSMVLMPSAEVHTTSSLWGSDSTSFDPRRFCQNQIFEAKKPASGYRPFGGGSFLCPGRFLAVNQITIILVVMVLKYDLEPVKGSSWSWPESQGSLATSILSPKGEIRVKMRERKDGIWNFEWKGRDTQSAI